MPFVKLDSGILRSTIWYRRPALEVFLTALLMAEPWEFTEDVPTIKIDSLDPDDFVVPKGWYGFVQASGPGIIHQSGIRDDKAGMDALRELSQPEAESRSQDFNGRRMVRVNGGYIVLNFMRYRDYDHNAAERMRKLRMRRKSEGVRANGVTVRANVTHSREQIAEADTESRERAAPPTLPEWLNECREKHPDWPIDDAQGAWEHYEKVGWMAGRNKVKKWRMCVGTCYRNFKQRGPFKNGNHTSDQRPNSRRYSQTDDYSKIPDRNLGP